ncbi:MAG TPA: glycosyltransferase family 2 protein [Rhodoferax sp.]
MRILSICIPTFNRANYLRTTLESIVQQDRFRNFNDIEIIISDNCSTDNTNEVSGRYVNLYINKVFYYKNSENILDQNFHKALSRGTGQYLKLNNDTLTHKSDSLEKMVETIEENLFSKPVLFFSNDTSGNFKKRYCNDLNAFVSTVSFYSTWIGGFGIWKSHFEKIEDFNKCSSLQLAQTDVLFRMVSMQSGAVVDNQLLFDTLIVQNKGGYDFIKVFLDNYLSILTSHHIDKETLKKEKRLLLLRHICPWVVTSKLRYGSTFKFKGANMKIIKHFRNDIFSIFLYYVWYFVYYCLFFVRKYRHIFCSKSIVGVS